MIRMRLFGDAKRGSLNVLSVAITHVAVEPVNATEDVLLRFGGRSKMAQETS
jgi:hypothetical protein